MELRYDKVEELARADIRIHFAQLPLFDLLRKIRRKGCLHSPTTTPNVLATPEITKAAANPASSASPFRTTKFTTTGNTLQWSWQTH